MEIKPDTDWDPESAPSFWINHNSRLLMRRFEQVLRPLGFGMAYFPVIVALQENGALLQKDLAKLARIEQPTMALLLGRMERDGLISRKPHPTDKRASQISLTAKTKKRLPQAKQAMKQIADQAIAGLSPREAETFLSLLKQVADNLNKSGAGSDDNLCDRAKR